MDRMPARARRFSFQRRRVRHSAGYVYQATSRLDGAPHSSQISLFQVVVVQDALGSVTSSLFSCPQRYRKTLRRRAFGPERLLWCLECARKTWSVTSRLLQATGPATKYCAGSLIVSGPLSVSEIFSARLQPQGAGYKKYVSIRTREV